MASPGFCVRGGAQVWRRDKTENNKCISYHPGQGSNLYSRICVIVLGLCVIHIVYDNKMKLHESKLKKYWCIDKLSWCWQTRATRLGSVKVTKHGTIRCVRYGFLLCALVSLSARLRISQKRHDIEPGAPFPCNDIDRPLTRFSRSRHFLTYSTSKMPWPWKPG